MASLAHRSVPSSKPGTPFGASAVERCSEEEALYPQEPSSPGLYVPPQVPGADATHAVGALPARAHSAGERAQLIGSSHTVARIEDCELSQVGNGASNGHAHGLTGRKTLTPNARGKAAVGETSYAASAAAAAAASAPVHQQASFSSRATLVLLVLVFVGVCSMIVTHESGDNVADLRGEVQRLRAQNEVLEERARLARQEQQDLAKIVLDPKAKKRMSGMLKRSQAFDTFIKKNGFAGTESNTNSVRKCLGRVLHDFNIQSVLDVPCGDGSWQHLIPGIENVTYVGAGINIKALETAKHRESNTGMEYLLFDPVHFPLQREFDLVLFRDAIEKQRVQDTLTAILNFKTSNSKYIAATFWPHSEEDVNNAAYNLADAGWYEANLIEKPFNFPAPIASCENDDQGGAHRGKQMLGIWRLKDLPVTPEAVQAAAPERHPDKADEEEGLPLPQIPGVHWIRHPQHAPIRGEPDMTLEDLLGHIGGMFPSNRRHEDRQRTPFDGLFSDFLETPGMVRHSSVPKQSQDHEDGQPRNPVQRRKVVLPTQFFQRPEFFPMHELMR